MASDQDFDEVESFMWHDSENGVAACALCGAPFHSPTYLDATSDSGRLRWTSRAILLTDGILDFSDIRLEDIPRSLLFKDRPIATIPAKLLGRGCFELTGGHELSGRIVIANQVEGDFHAELYMPIHEACFRLLERFLAAGYPAPSPQIGQWTLSKVWDVLRLRLEAAQGDANLGGGLEGVEQLPEPHGYYVTGGPEPAFQWTDSLSLTDPLDVGEYTGVLLAHVPSISEPGEGSNDAVGRLRKGFEALPQELQDRILDFVTPGNVRLTCNRVLPRVVWKRMFSKGLLTPFLWDLHSGTLDEGRDQRDYELLVRRLAQPAAFDHPHGDFADAPPGLRNRRRTWRVLENMKAGDFHHVSRGALSIFRGDGEDEE